jgi:hypothetical protein
MFLTRGRAKAKLWPAARFALIALVSFLAVAHPSESRADVWNWLTGLVTAHPDSEAELSGMELPPDAIVTKDGETRVLRLGRDVLELHPSTAVTIEKTGSSTSVRLITGTVRVKVAKRTKSQRFDVRTLMLVATVKGTDFEVSTSRSGSAVSVHEGRVAVKATSRVGGIDVTPGRTATVTGTEKAPTLGPTPSGGATAAVKALGRPAKSRAASRGGDEDDDGGRDHNKDMQPTGRNAAGAGVGSGGGSDSDGGGGDGEGGDGEGGDGEGGDGEGGDDGDDD